tara:strand:- start:979 stop:1158 length:180 start_codon:yes stop_codon:yes gene_type:complete
MLGVGPKTNKVEAGRKEWRKKKGRRWERDEYGGEEKKTKKIGSCHYPLDRRIKLALVRF